jgi:Ser/Thr protein kinase RdoA (MazF antagonist)
MPDFYALPPAAQVERLRELGHAALAHWDVGACALTLIKFRENAVFEATTGAGHRYALRIHRAGYHSDAELRSELEWMRALEASGFDVPEIVPARSGALFVTVRQEGVPEPRQVDLFEWIEGAQLGSVGGEAATDSAALARTYHTVGTLAARLHNQATRWPLPAGFTRHAWDDAGLVGEQPLWGRFWELAALTDPQRALLIRARDRLRRDLGALTRSPDSYGLIHADFAPENLLVDGERVRLLDFDDAGFGWHLFEIATSIYFHIGEPHYEAIRASTIAGYRSERALPDEELARLPMFLCARGFTYLGWVHTRSETETARELTPMLIELACTVAGDYLGPSRQRQ